MPISDPTMPAQQAPPESKPTVAMAQVPPWAIELTKSVKDGFRDVQDHFDRQDATLATLTNNDLTASARMAKFEVRLDGIEERQNKTSMNVRQTSDHSLEADAKLADIILWRASVATKEDLAKTTAAQTTALLTELRTNPIVHKVLYAIGGAIAAYAAQKGIHLL